MIFKAPSDACKEILILNIMTFFPRLETLLVGTGMVIVMELSTMTAMREVRRRTGDRGDNLDYVENAYSHM